MSKSNIDTLPKFISLDQLEIIIEQKLVEYSLTEKSYPICSKQIISKINNLEIHYKKFSNHLIGGICYKGQKSSAILLNTMRSNKGQNFDCMHELIHYWFHPQNEYLNISKNFVHQNKSYEWQANNGAAIALMPTILFKRKCFEFNGDIEKLSDFFMVGEMAVRFRIENISQISL
ncbi:ImmA/IrrE family metallo-endopeptidase [bacterium AH-315-E09]|nr:ImmA/IrrE family metallo-endopeptidase [Alkaliphilus sp. AH-315-G20]MBN4074648.1 ImmA/IrrE family metallo-endopeptidase [bacterium AH-315-E09]